VGVGQPCATGELVVIGNSYPERGVKAGKEPFNFGETVKRDLIRDGTNGGEKGQSIPIF